MQNFQFSMPTNVLFGRDQLKNLPDVLGQFGRKVLLTYGGGSIKKTGLYDRIMALLVDFEVFELGGIDPNPRVESVEEGAKICREKGIDVILAVGGGSTMDCSKAIAGAVYYEGGAWEMVKESRKAPVIQKAVPLCTVVTLAATGSETNSTGVISNIQTNEKIGFFAAPCQPKYSILEPENTFTVPKSQTAAGSADIMSHLFEVYFARESALVPDSICEALLKTVVHYAPIAIAEPNHYEARANLMWAASLAINGLCAAGQWRGPWTCHMIEHELSAFYDITHGVGLAIVTPRWMRFILNEDTVDKFARYGIEVWNLDAGQDRYAIAKQAIDKTEAFFVTLGIPMTLTEVGIGTENFEAMAKKAVEGGGLAGAYVPLTSADVVKILEDSL